MNKNYYVTLKSHALNFIDPKTNGKRLYFESQKGYKKALLEIAVAAVMKLRALGVNINITIDREQKEDKKEAA